MLYFVPICKGMITFVATCIIFSTGKEWNKIFQLWKKHSLLLRNKAKGTLVHNAAWAFPQHSMLSKILKKLQIL